MNELEKSRHERDALEATVREKILAARRVGRWLATNFRADHTVETVTVREKLLELDTLLDGLESLTRGLP